MSVPSTETISQYAMHFAHAVYAIETWALMLLTGSHQGSGILQWLCMLMPYDNNCIGYEYTCPMTFSDIQSPPPAGVRSRNHFVAVADTIVSTMPDEITDTILQRNSKVQWCDTDTSEWRSVRHVPPVLMLAATNKPFVLSQCTVQNNAVTIRIGNVEYAVRYAMWFEDDGSASYVTWKPDAQLYLKDVNYGQRCLSRDLLAVNAEFLMLERVGVTATTTLPYYSITEKTSRYWNMTSSVSWYSTLSQHIYDIANCGGDWPGQSPPNGYFLNIHMRDSNALQHVSSIVDCLESKADQCVVLIVDMHMSTAHDEYKTAYLQALEKLLQHFKNITHLDLTVRGEMKDDRSPPGRRLNKAFLALRQCKRLQFVSLCHLKDMLRTCDIGSIIGPSVQLLRITDVALDCSDRNLLKSMLTNARSLKALQLERARVNRVEDVDAALGVVCASLRYFQWTAVRVNEASATTTLPGLRACERMTSLCIGKVHCPQLSKPTWVDVADAIVNMRNLRHYNVYRPPSDVDEQFSVLQRLHDKAVPQSVGMEAMTPTETTHLCKLMNGPSAPDLTTLTLAQCKLPSKLQCELFQGLSRCNNLNTLHLSVTKIAETSILADALQKMPAMRELCFNTVSITDVHLLFGVIKGFSALQILEFENMRHIGDSAVQTLLGDPDSMPTLCELTLAACGISDQAALTVCRWVKKHPRLAHLNLIGNAYGNSMSVSLTDAVCMLWPGPHFFAVGGVATDAQTVKTICERFQRQNAYAKLRVGASTDNISNDLQLRAMSLTATTPKGVVVPVVISPVPLPMIARWFKSRRGEHKRMSVLPERATGNASRYMCVGAPQVLVADTYALLQLPAMPAHTLNILGKRVGATAWTNVGVHSPQIRNSGLVWVDTSPLTVPNTTAPCVFRVDHADAAVSAPVHIRPRQRAIGPAGSLCRESIVHVHLTQNMMNTFAQLQYDELQTQSLTTKIDTLIQTERVVREDIARLQSQLEAKQTHLTGVAESQTNLKNQRTLTQQTTKRHRDTIQQRYKNITLKASQHRSELEVLVRNNALEELTTTNVRELLRMISLSHKLPAECRVTGLHLQVLAALAPPHQADLCKNLGVPDGHLSALLSRMGVRLGQLAAGQIADISDALKCASRDVTDASPETPPRKRQCIDQTSLSCPISMAPFEDAVSAVDGHTYNRSGIESWLKMSTMSPTTRRPLETQHLITNVQVQEFVQRAREE